MRTSNAALHLAALASLLLLPACSGGGGGGSGGSASSIPTQATSCPTDLGQDFSASRKVEVGDGASPSFEPYAEGEKISLIKGLQGLDMITPALRVAAAPGDGAQACLLVRLENDYQGGIANDPTATDALQTNVLFVRSGDALLSSGALYDPFSFTRAELTGVTLKLTATVKGKGFQGTSTAHVVLE